MSRFIENEAENDSESVGSHASDAEEDNVNEYDSEDSFIAPEDDVAAEEEAVRSPPRARRRDRSRISSPIQLPAVPVSNPDDDDEEEEDDNLSDVEGDLAASMNRKRKKHRNLASVGAPATILDTPSNAGSEETEVRMVPTPSAIPTNDATNEAKLRNEFMDRTDFDLAKMLERAEIASETDGDLSASSNASIPEGAGRRDRFGVGEVETGRPIPRLPLMLHGDPFDGHLESIIMQAAMQQNTMICLYVEADLEMLLHQWEQYWFLAEYKKVSMTTEVVEKIIKGRFCDPGKSEAKAEEYAADMKLYLHTHIKSTRVLRTMFGINKMLEDKDPRYKNNRERFSKLEQRIQQAFDQRAKSFQLVNWNDKQSLDKDFTAANVLKSGNADVKYKDIQNLAIFIDAACTQHKLSKDPKGNLYQEIKNMDGHTTHSVQTTIKIKEFIMRQTKGIGSNQWGWRTSGQHNANIVARDFAENFEDGCPLVERDYNAYSFSNLRWTIDNNTGIVKETFTPYGPDVKFTGKYSMKYLPDPLLDTEEAGAPHFVDPETGCYLNILNQVIYNPAVDPLEKKPIRSCSEIETPLLEKILTDQKFPRNVKWWWYFSMGRLSVPVGLANGGDNLQYIPIGYGKAQTGKSTLVSYALDAFYLRTDIGYLESEGETTFALQGLRDKLVWVILELKKELRLSGARFQSMVSGEEVVIPVKQQESETIKWKLPGVMIGNDRIPFTDAQGSITRRCLTWEFLKRIRNVDTSLQNRMVKEMPNFIRKCKLFYFHCIQAIGKRVIWDCVPDYFRNTQANLKENVDVVEYYIRNFCVQDAGNMQYFVPFDRLAQDISEKLKNAGKSEKGTVTADMIRSTLDQRGFQLFCLNGDKGRELRTAYLKVIKDGKEPMYDQDFLDRTSKLSVGLRSDLSLEYESVLFKNKVYTVGEFVVGILPNAFLEDYSHNKLKMFDNSAEENSLKIDLLADQFGGCRILPA